MILRIGRSSLVVCITVKFFSRNTQYAIRNTRKAFTLIEVMLSVAILSIALVLILQAFAHSLSILRITEDNLTATLIAGNKMAEAQIMAKEDWDSFEKGMDKRFRSQDIKCRWKMDIAAVELDTEDDFELDGALNEVNASLSWEEGIRSGVITLSTFMKNYEEE